MYISWAPMSGGKVPEYCIGFQEYKSGSLCQVGRSQSIELGFLCVCPGLYGRWEGTRVQLWGPIYISGPYDRW